MSEPTRAVIYAAKSTEDKHGSIDTQIKDCEALADREGWEVVGEPFTDEGFSAYSGNRGPGLERARQVAVNAAPCVLVAQHSDRVARGAGDAPDAAEHLVEVVTALRRQEVTLRTCQDDFFGDTRIGTVMAALMGMRNTEDSARKSEATKAGLARRKERGDPVGRVPLGYKAESGSRVIDPVTRGIVERIFGLVEAGKSFGDVSRILNSEGVTTKRGTPFVPRTVSKIVANTSYKGEKGYPAIIPAKRFDAIHASLTRLDPAQVAKRKGGRKARDDSFVLRGVLFCKRCGGTFYTRRQKGGRVYVCRNRRQSTGLCDAPVIPAELVESHVLEHLDTFVGWIEDWIRERMKERDSERSQREKALDRQREKLHDLDRLRGRAYDTYRKLLDEGKSTAPLALEEVERIDGERDQQRHAIERAEALLGEFSGPPDVDAALDYYTELVDVIQGRIGNAESARELNEALRTVVAGMWAQIEDDRLVVKFELLGVERGDQHVVGSTLILADLERRPELPPRRLDLDPRPYRDPNFVYVQPSMSCISAYE